MKSRSFAATICFLSLALPATADSFLMKDGSTLEGTILRQDADSYVVEVNITKSIKDEKVIAKADVVRVKREKLDLVAFEQIEALVPTPDVLSSADYTDRVLEVKKFLKDHAGSSMTRRAKIVLDTLNKEAAAVAGGSIKMNGKMLSPAGYKANAYEIDALVADGKIRALVKGSHLLQALRAFNEFETNFQNTPQYAELVPLMGKVMKKHLADTKQSLATFDSRVEERMLGLERMSRGDRRSTEKAILEQLAALQKRFDKEQKEKIGWVTTHPFFKPSMEATMTYGKQRLTRLAAPVAAGPVDGGKAYREALALIKSSPGSPEATAAINAAKGAKVGPQYMETLEAAASAVESNP